MKVTVKDFTVTKVKKFEDGTQTTTTFKCGEIGLDGGFEEVIKAALELKKIMEENKMVTEGKEPTTPLPETKPGKLGKTKEEKEEAKKIKEQNLKNLWKAYKTPGISTHIDGKEISFMEPNDTERVLKVNGNITIERIPTGYTERKRFTKAYGKDFLKLILEDKYKMAE